MKNRRIANETDGSANEQVKPRPKYRLVKNMAKTLLAVSTLPAAAGIDAVAQTNNSFTASAVHNVINNVKENSSALGPAINATRANLVTSLPPILSRDFCPPAPSPDRREEIRQQIESAIAHPDVAVARPKAEAKGLHFADPNETFTKIKAAQNAIDATAAVSEFTKTNYGFNVTPDFNASLLSKAGLDTYKGRLDLMTLMIGTLPSELLQGTGVDSVHIKTVLNVINGSNGTHAAGTYNPSAENPGHGTVDLEIDYIDHPYVFIHEAIGHGINFSVCRGYPEDDKAFTQFNPRNFSYTEGDDPSTDYPTTVSPSNYATTNSVEDEAELTRVFITGDDLNQRTEYLDEEPMTKKLEVLLDRIDTIAPGSVEYLAQVRPIFSNIQALAWESKLGTG